MSQHSLHFSLTLPLPREQVFAFYCDAANLGRITPPELEFRILTPLPIAMRQGALIEYRLRLFNVPFHWVTEIRKWAPPVSFVDAQKTGPFREWVHSHTFRENKDGSTTIEDELRYRLPAFPVGEAAFPLVHKELERIFTYRQEMIRSLLVPVGPHTPEKG